MQLAAVRKQLISRDSQLHGTAAAADELAAESEQHIEQIESQLELVSSRAQTLEQASADVDQLMAEHAAQIEKLEVQLHRAQLSQTAVTVHNLKTQLLDSQTKLAEKSKAVEDAAPFDALEGIQKTLAHVKEAAEQMNAQVNA